MEGTVNKAKKIQIVDSEQDLKILQKRQPLQQSLESRANYSRDKVSFIEPTKLTKNQTGIKLKVFKKPAPLVPARKLEEESQIQSLAQFFVENSYVNLRNYNKAKSLFLGLFSSSVDFQKNFLLLSQELDKKTDKYHKFGKAYLSMQKSGKLCLERSSPSLGYLKQYISVDVSKNDLVTYTIWEDKARGVELIRSAKLGNKKKVNDKSLKFDANIWKKFNSYAILPKHYLKIMDCVERNHLNLEQFTRLVNKKEISKLFTPLLINEPKITSNAKDTTFFDFKTNALQNVNIKITKAAVSLIVAHS